MKKSLILILILSVTISESYCMGLNSLADNLSCLTSSLSSLSIICKYNKLKHQINEAKLRDRNSNPIKGSELMMNELKVLGLELKFEFTYRKHQNIGSIIKDRNIINTCE